MFEKKRSFLDKQGKHGKRSGNTVHADSRGVETVKSRTSQIISLALILSAVVSTSESAGAELHGFKDPLQHDDGGGAEAGDHLRVQGQGADRRGLRELRRRD